MDVLLGDARAVLPTLDLSETVVMTDPPWTSGAATGIVGAGAEARSLWSDVAALLGRARAVVVYQSSLEEPFTGPPLPFYQTCWMRSVPPSYRGTRILSHVAHVYGLPPRPRGARVHSSECASRSTESRRERLDSGHPCPMSLDHARWLVRWFGEGARILDPFTGGGHAAQSRSGARPRGDRDRDRRALDPGRSGLDRARAQAGAPRLGLRGLVIVALELVPITIRDASAFVDRWHRHHRAPRGALFAIAAALDGSIVAVATVGRPVARRLQDGWTAEVTRVCALEGARNACSLLYSAAWRAARAMGYRRLVTYTLPSESGASLRGASLRGAGFRLVGEAGGGTWSRRARPRVDEHPTQGKLRWEQGA